MNECVLHRTGTLTENKMQVVSVYTFGAEDTPISARDRLIRKENVQGIQALQILACVCNAAKVRLAFTSLSQTALTWHSLTKYIATLT